MSLIKGYIAEEVERLDRMEKRITDVIKSLPAGTVQKRVIKNREYGYLKVYEEGKTKQKYLGPYHSDLVQSFIKKIEERQNHEKSLKRILQDRTFGTKALSLTIKTPSSTTKLRKIGSKIKYRKD